MPEFTLLERMKKSVRPRDFGDATYDDYITRLTFYVEDAKDTVPDSLGLDDKTRDAARQHWAYYTAHTDQLLFLLGVPSTVQIPEQATVSRFDLDKRMTHATNERDRRFRLYNNKIGSGITVLPILQPYFIALDPNSLPVFI